MKQFSKILILFVLNFYSTNSTALVLDSSKTAILTTDNVKNNLKLKQAFAQILVKNTGEDITQIINNPVFKQSKIKDGIKRSYFEKLPSSLETEDDSYQYWFHLVMNQEYIDKVIHLADFSLWPQDRHKIMLWPVTLSEDNKTIHSIDNDSFVYWAQRWAQALGLVVIFPNENDLAINPDSIKNLQEDAADYAKNQYNIHHNLLVYIDENEDRIKLRTGFFGPQEDVKIKHFQEDIASKISIFYSMMSELTSNYSYLYSLKPSEIKPHTQQVQVGLISNYDDVLNLNNYFNLLSVIDSYEVIKATPNELVIRMELKVTNEAFINIINRGDLLELSEDLSLHQLTFNFKNQN
jgi:hypothetical protein